MIHRFVICLRHLPISHTEHLTQSKVEYSHYRHLICQVQQNRIHSPGQTLRTRPLTQRSLCPEPSHLPPPSSIPPPAGVKLTSPVSSSSEPRRVHSSSPSPTSYSRRWFNVHQCFQSRILDSDGALGLYSWILGPERNLIGNNYSLLLPLFKL